MTRAEYLSKTLGTPFALTFQRLENPDPQAASYCAPVARQIVDRLGNEVYVTLGGVGAFPSSLSVLSKGAWEALAAHVQESPTPPLLRILANTAKEDLSDGVLTLPWLLVKYLLRSASFSAEAVETFDTLLYFLRTAERPSGVIALQAWVEAD